MRRYSIPVFMSTIGPMVISTEQDILTTLQAVSAGEIDDRDFFWSVVSYEDWKVPLKKIAPEMNSAFDLSAQTWDANPIRKENK
jgi:hypothetical protein